MALANYYKCASCGENAVFDPKSGKLCCSVCGKEAPIEAAPPEKLPIASEADFAAAPETPTGICPFLITREEAAAACQKWIRPKLLCPAAARKLAAADFRGAYLPGWTYSAGVVSHYSGSYGVDRPEKDRYGRMRTATDWYPASGTFAEDYADRLVWGTDRFDEKLLAELTPYKTCDCRAFDAAYTAGFEAEKASIPADAAWRKARRLIEADVLKDVRAKVIDDKGAHHIKDIMPEIAYNGISCQYLLLPVWIAATTVGGKDYCFLVNGETGKVAGKAPKSAVRTAIAAILCLAAAVGLYLWTKGL